MILDEENTSEPRTTAPRVQKDTEVRDNTTKPSPLMSSKVKTIMIVVGMMVVASGIIFSNSGKSKHKKSDDAAKSTTQAASDSSPASSASQLRQQVMNEDQRQRYDEQQAQQALAIAQQGGVSPMYDANGNISRASQMKGGSNNAVASHLNQGDGAAAKPSMAEMVREEIDKKLLLLQFDTHFQSNLVYRAEPVQQGQQYQSQMVTPRNAQYTQSAQVSSGEPAGRSLQQRLAEVTSGVQPFGSGSGPSTQNAQPQAQQEREDADRKRRESEINVNRSVGANYVIYEGNFLDTVLLNQIDGDEAGPVIVMVNQPLYSHDRQQVLIPEGSKVFGTTRRIGGDGFGQQRRMALTFHRIIMPDGYSIDLDQYSGLDQVGQMGIRDKVNNHYAQIFGTSMALGVIAGTATAVEGGGSATSTSGRQLFVNGSTSQVSSSATSIMNKFMMIPSTHTIRPGHRVKVYFTQDMALPAYRNHRIYQVY